MKSCGEYTDRRRLTFLCFLQRQSSILAYGC